MVTKTFSKIKRFTKFEKIATFFKKLLKFVTLKSLEHSVPCRNYAVAYYQTLEEVP